MKTETFVARQIKALSIALIAVCLSLLTTGGAYAYQQKFVIKTAFLHKAIIVALESNVGGEAQIQKMTLNNGTPLCSQRADGSWLVLPRGTCIFTTVNNIHAGWRMCADSVPALFQGASSSSSLNCWDGKHTRIEVSEASPGTNLDISVIPSGNNAGVFCNDPQWGGCSYNNADKTVYVASMGGNIWCSQLKPSQPEAAQCNGTITSQSYCSGSGLKAAYNIGVTASCHTNTNNYNKVITLTCTGSPTLGAAGYPSNCGFKTLTNQLNNCIGDGGTNCYQAFFSPMSQGSPSSPTQNGQYYCGFTNLQQPDITCSSQSTPIGIIFWDPNG